MKFNPFQPNQIVAPGMFTGRVDELDTIEQCLFQAKCGNPQHFLIQGERGIGKSSLLFLVSAIADGTVKLPTTDKMNFIVLSVDLGNVQSQYDIVRTIARSFRTELARIRHKTEKAQKIWTFLSNWEVLGVRYHKDGLSPDPDDARDELIEQIVDLCSTKDCIDGIFIIVDEADAPPVEAGLGEFVKTFTERLTKRRCNNVILALAGLPALLVKLRASHESSPRVFEVLSLEPLEDEERQDVVRKGLAEANQKNQKQTMVTPDALQALAHLSEGYPHFVQQFAYSAFDTDDDNMIDVDDVFEGAYKENGAIAQLGSKYFNEMYYGKISSDEYRKVLDTMAGHSDRWVARKTLVEQSGIKQSTMANALNALKGRNIILSDTSRQGYYRLPTKSFAAWINAVKSVELRKSPDNPNAFGALFSADSGQTD